MERLWVKISIRGKYFKKSIASLINPSKTTKTWKDHPGAGKRKDRCVGNGRRKGWEKKRDEDRADKTSFIFYIVHFSPSLFTKTQNERFKQYYCG